MKGSFTIEETSLYYQQESDVRREEKNHLTMQTYRYWSYAVAFYSLRRCNHIILLSFIHPFQSIVPELTHTSSGCIDGEMLVEIRATWGLEWLQHSRIRNTWYVFAWSYLWCSFDDRNKWKCANHLYYFSPEIHYQNRILSFITQV